MPDPVPNAAPTNKAIAATGGSAFGAAIAVLINWGITKVAGAAPPAEVAAAIATVVTAVVTLAAAYYTPPGSSETVIATPDGMKSATLK